MWMVSFLGYCMKKVFVVVVMALKNHLLSYGIIIHKSASYEETLLMMISMFLRMCKSLVMSMKFFVLFLCGG
jgi:hypothetical protein